VSHFQSRALPREVQASARALLSAAVAVKVACELGEVDLARHHAQVVLTALDRLVVTTSICEPVLTDVNRNLNNCTDNCPPSI